MEAVGSIAAGKDASDFADIVFVQYPLTAHESVYGCFKGDGLMWLKRLSVDHVQTPLFFESPGVAGGFCL